MNLIPEGKDRAIMRKLMRPFAPDADRLEGLEVTQAPVTGADLLNVGAQH